MLNPFSQKYKIYRLRKRYDRIREKADKLGKRKAFPILKTLDAVSGYLTQLEEQNIPMLQRRRTVQAVENAIKQAKQFIKQGELRQPTGVNRNPQE